MNPEYHFCCTCGFKWKHGEHGGHDCSVRLLEKIKTLEKGLKDHEIAGLVNALRDNLSDRFNLPQSLREIISRIVVRYLEKNNLKIDGDR